MSENQSKNGAVASLGRVGLWTRQLDMRSAGEAEDAAAEIEELGYRSLWIPEATHREAISHAALLLAATRSLVVATGVARVHARSPQAAVLAQRLICERWPGRFVLGLGVSHPMVIERMMGQVYGPPLATMAGYLDGMDATRGGPAEVPGGVARVIAALGPKMLALAAQRSSGAHTYLSPVEHTAWARGELGSGPLLAPAIKVVLTDDIDAGLAVARWSLAPTVKMPAYRSNVLRSGFTDDDLADGLTDRLVHALVAIGDVDAVVKRVREHLAAGADHVCIEVLTGDDVTIPMEQWRRLGPALAEIG
jgi:probable F420-dependent oxidoreductase